MSYYIGDLERDPNLENYPFRIWSLGFRTKEVSRLVKETQASKRRLCNFLRGPGVQASGLLVFRV